MNIGPRALHRRGRGFSLVEVMVALVVCAVGLLGLAKMESLAVASTSVAGARSIAAIQASSLAAAMHANPGFWAAGLAPQVPVTVTAITGSAVAISDAGLSSVPPSNCSVPGPTSCTPGQMAAFDVQQWAAALQTLLPGSFSTITCTPLTSAPVTCNIQIQWTEKAIAANTQQSNVNALQLPTYILYVQP